MGSSAINNSTSAATSLQTQTDTPVTVTQDNGRPALVRSSSAPASLGGLERMQNRPTGGTQGAAVSRRASFGPPGPIGPRAPLSGSSAASLHSTSSEALTSPSLSVSTDHGYLADLSDATPDSPEDAGASAVRGMVVAALMGSATQAAHGGGNVENGRSLEAFGVRVNNAVGAMPTMLSALLENSYDSGRFSEVSDDSGYAADVESDGESDNESDTGASVHGGIALPVSMRPATLTQTQTPHPGPQSAPLGEHPQALPIESGHESPVSSNGAHGMERGAIPLVPIQTNRPGSSSPAHPAATAAPLPPLPPLDKSDDGALERWAKNAIKVVGHRAFSVGLATGIREVVNAGVEALMQGEHVSDDVKTGVASAMMGLVILANIGSAAYRFRRGDSRWSYAGNAAQAASLAASLAGALKAGTLKDQVSNLAKVGGYSAARDLMTMMVPLRDNLHPNPHPIVTQMINSAFYTVNQFLVNSAQSFHGISGAGIYDGLHGNQTLTGKERSSFIKDSAKGMAVYIAANTAGEIADTIMPRIIQYRMQHGSFEGLGDLEFKLGGQRDSLLDTMMDSVIPRLSLFDTVYAGTSALNTKTNTPGIGERGATYLDSFTSALMIATLCIPYAMTGVRKTSQAVRAGLDSLRRSQASLPTGLA
jgi:hypothetical protein